MLKEKISKKQILGIILLTFMFVMIGAREYYNSYTDIGPREDIVSGVETNVGKIWNGRVLEQSFTTDEDFCGVALFMGTLGKPIQIGEVEVTVTDVATGEVVLDATRNMESIADKTYIYFVGDDTVEVDGETEYLMTITGRHVMKSFGVTIWSTFEDRYADGTLVVDGASVDSDLCFSVVERFDGGVRYHAFARRVLFLSILYVFLLLHIILNIRKMYQWIFKYRWVITFALFAFCVANKINGSSMAQYDGFVQQGYGSDYVQPLFGHSRAIRGDEWSVSLPRALSAEYTDYGATNDIVMATEHSGLSASGLYRSYSALAQPSNWGYYLFGSEYGLSYIWCFHVIFGFAFSFELSYILTKKNKILGLLGASLISLSMFNMAWSVVSWLFAGQAALVLFYYFISQEKVWKKVLLGVGIAVFAAEFVINLYPAWQVPAGYIYLGLLVWMFFSQKESWKNYRMRDWLVAILCVAFLASLVVAYLYDDIDYIEDISSTLYPAGRVDYGGFALTKLFGYLSITIASFVSSGNVSEASCFFNLFPASAIFFFYVFIKKRGKSLLMWCITVPTLFLTLYCTMELPHKLVELTLMTNSMRSRAVDVVGYANVLMLLIALSEVDEIRQLKWYVVVPIIIGSVALTLHYSTGMEDRTILFVIVLLGLFAMAAGVLLFIGNKLSLKQYAAVALALVVGVSGLSFNPIHVGTDTITTKPVAAEIQKIAEEDADAKWIGVNSRELAEYLVALGAKTVNSTNYVPNMEFWQYFDPDGTVEEIYNRYAHLTIELVDDETSFSLLAADSIDLKLNYEDLDDLGVTYLFSTVELSSDHVSLEELYGEYGAFIYKVCN